MKDKLLNNLGLKAGSLVIALFLWLVVVNVSDPVVDSTFPDVPLTVVNAESLTNEGKVYEMTGASTVTVAVSAKRSILDSLSGDNFKAEVDLGLYNEETGMVPVKVDCNRYTDKIESMKSRTESVEVLVEDGLAKQFVITPEVSGEPADGFIIGDVTTAENVVRISGRESVVSGIAKVTAEVSVDGLGSDVNTSVDLKLYDKNGEQIKNTNLLKNISTVAISVEILATKELELRYNYSGKPADGYTVSGELTGDKETIMVAGRSNDLARLSYVDIAGAYVDVSGMSETTSVEVNLERVLPDSLSLVNRDDNIVTITVPIEELVTREVAIGKGTIKISGLPGNNKCEVLSDGPVSFEVTGVQTVVDALNTKDIKASVDWDAYMDEHNLAELSSGSYRLPLILVLPEGVSTPKDVMVSLRVTKAN
ncbi:MAG: hypothetical protein K6E84_03625 [Lachnospiraceae bacterium]|nr:hypothetical protein [Lachnospiraceae bacterium]